MTVRKLWAVLIAVPMLIGVSQANAHQPCCQTCCETQYVEKTIYEPCWVTELRKVQYTEWKCETRERRFKVCKVVPETTQVQQDYTVMVPKEESKIVKYRVSVPVVRDVEKKYTVMVPVFKDVQRDYFVQVPVTTEVDRPYTVIVPQKELRTATRTVCQNVPMIEKRLITKDCGHFETHCQDICVSSCCGCRSCNPCCSTAISTVCKKVWVPHIVQEEIEVTVCKRQCHNEQYEYSVTVCRPETRIQKVQVCNYVTEKRSDIVKVKELIPEERVQIVKVHDCVIEDREKEVKCIIHVPENRVRTLNVTKYVNVEEERAETYEVKIPVVMERDVEVKVCKMVPKCVVVPVTHCHTVCGPARHCCY